jgi:hypothetical protein
LLPQCLCHWVFFLGTGWTLDADITVLAVDIAVLVALDALGPPDVPAALLRLMRLKRLMRLLRQLVLMRLLR